MTIYLQALQACEHLLQRALGTDTLLASLQAIIEPIILRTADSNTRTRKKSVEIIQLVWDFKSKLTFNKDDSQP